MKFEYINWKEIQDTPQDNNQGYIFGINFIDEDTGHPEDTQWFKTEKERDQFIQENKLEEFNWA